MLPPTLVPLLPEVVPREDKEVRVVDQREAVPRDIQDRDQPVQEDQPEPVILPVRQRDLATPLDLDPPEPDILREDQPEPDSPPEVPWPMLDPAVDAQRVAVPSTHSQDIIIKAQKALALLMR